MTMMINNYNILLAVANFFSFTEYLVLNCLMKNNVSVFAEAEFFCTLMNIDEKIGSKVCNRLIKFLSKLDTSIVFNKENLILFVNKRVCSMKKQIGAKMANLRAKFDPDMPTVKCYLCMHENHFTIFNYGVCAHCSTCNFDLNFEHIKKQESVCQEMFNVLNSLYQTAPQILCETVSYT